MNEEYYTTLYESVPEKWVVISTFEPDKTKRAVRAKHLTTEIPKRVSEIDSSIYATFAVFDEQPTSGRGTNEKISAILGAFLDFDIGSDSRYSDDKNPAMSLDEVKALALSFGLPEPSAIVASGHGYHFDYWLGEPFFIKNKADRDRAAKMLKGFNAYAIQHASEAGFKMDNMGDLARVKRVAGSLNYREGEAPAPAEVVELHPARTYTIEHLETFTPKVSRLAVKPTPAREGKGASWSLIVENDPFVQYCIANAVGLPYGHWFAALGIAARCENGREVAHDFSRLDPTRYKTTETDNKIDEVLKAKGAVTYDHIATELGFTEVVHNRLTSRLHTPLDFGTMDPEVIRLVRNNVYDMASARFYDQATLEPVLKEGFQMQHGHRLRNPLAAFRTSPLAIKAIKADYLPGQPRLVGLGENPVLNLYRAPDFTAAKGECDTILAHFTYLIPEAKEREFVLDYLAHMRQHPGVKINKAILFIGPQGNGKSTVTRLMTPLFGSQNVKTLPADAISNRFQADRTNLQLLVVEELMGIDREAEGGLREWITADIKEVEEKGTPRFKARSPRGMIFTSNHREAIPIQKGDRRFAVIQTNERKESDAYFARLAKEEPNESAAFAYWLDHRDISAFDPFAPAPDTALKFDMQRLSLSPLELAITEAMEDEDGVFADDVGTAEQVGDLIVMRGWNRPRPTPTSVAQALHRVGAKSLGEKRLREKGKVRLWAFRDTERWMDADTDTLYEAYHPRHPFAPTGNVVALRQNAA